MVCWLNVTKEEAPLLKRFGFSHSFSTLEILDALECSLNGEVATVSQAVADWIHNPTKGPAGA